MTDAGKDNDNRISLIYLDTIPNIAGKRKDSCEDKEAKKEWWGSMKA
jgi:hypothetical protein